MEEWIQLILFIIFGGGALLTRVLSRKGSKEEPDIAPEEEVTLPPWGNSPMEEDIPLPELIEEEVHASPSEPPTESQFASSPEAAAEETQDQPSTDSSPPTIPTIAGIPLSPQTFRQGVILAEILRPPKSLRQPRP